MAAALFHAAARALRAACRLEWGRGCPNPYALTVAPRSGSVRRTGARKRRNASFATQSSPDARLRQPAPRGAGGGER